MNIAIVLSGGIGSRMNLSKPKQFIKINNAPVLSYTLLAFEKSKLIDSIVIVNLKSYEQEIMSIISSYKISKFQCLVNNGKTRQESVFNALSKIKNFAKDDDIILIHDGARAMIDKNTIDNCVIQTKKYNLTTLAEKSKNTMIISKNSKIDSFIDRNYVYNLQTPQGFRFNIIYNSHIKANSDNLKNITDDTQIAMYNNHKVHIIENDLPNLKLTTKEDIHIFQYYLKDKFNN